MAYLNKNERDALQTELSGMRFRPALGRLRRMDPKSRLVFYRNVQGVDKWNTRYDLIGLGTRVTLTESYAHEEQLSGKIKADYELVDVKVEALPENKT